MEPSLIICDRVSANAEDIRRTALAFNFGDAFVDGIRFSGVLFHKQLDALVREDICRTISTVLRGPIAPKASFFRLYNAQHQPSSYIHSDADPRIQWAAVYHLTLPELCFGGTAFWRHKGLGIDRLHQSQSDQRWQFFKEGLDESLWEMTDLASARFNRLVIYPSQCFHSQYPRAFPGPNKHCGRLTWVCFFNLSNRMEAQSEVSMEPPTEQSIQE